MKIIIAGSRDFLDYRFLKSKLDFLLSKSGDQKITVISGMARGADSLGIKYASEKGFDAIKIPANWDLYGKRAGYLRNVEMAKIASHCVIFCLNESKGSIHMQNIAKQYNLGLRVYHLRSIND